MKLRLLIITTLLLAGGTAFAQEESASRISIRLGAGLPGAGAEYFTQGLIPTSVGLSDLYGDYVSDLSASPAISIEAYYIHNQWFRFGLDFIYNSYSNQILSGITDQPVRDRNGQSFIVLPTASVNYFQKGALLLYMGLGFGVGYYSGFDNMNSKLNFNVQFTPFGIEYGRDVFCFAEANLGTAVNWVRGGVGFRF